MLDRFPVFWFALVSAALVLSVGASACRPDLGEPRTAIPADTARAVAPAASDSSSRASASTDTQAVTGAIPARSEREAVAAAGSFLEAIRRGDTSVMRGMLSARSRNMLDELGASGEIVSIGRESLGHLRDGVEFTPLGGRADSVAMLITGRRAGDTERQESILILLREGSTWKIMYPGALNPREHLRR